MPDLFEQNPDFFKAIYEQTSDELGIGFKPLSIKRNSSAFNKLKEYLPTIEFYKAEFEGGKPRVQELVNISGKLNNVTKFYNEVFRGPLETILEYYSPNENKHISIEYLFDKVEKNNSDFNVRYYNKKPEVQKDSSETQCDWEWEKYQMNKRRQSKWKEILLKMERGTVQLDAIIYYSSTLSDIITWMHGIIKCILETKYIN